MLKKFLIAANAPIIYLSSALPAFAQEVNPCPDIAPWNTLCAKNITNVGSVISTVVTILFIVAIIIALFFLIFGGIKWIISGGDKTAVEGARNMIIAAVVGLVIALLSFFILNLILGIFGLNLGNLELPSIF